MARQSIAPGDLSPDGPVEGGSGGRPITEEDIRGFQQGTHGGLHRLLGAHRAGAGVRFAVWAPNARALSVIGEFNGWQPGAAPLQRRPDGSGIWEGEVAAAGPGHCYKYWIEIGDGAVLERGDPFAGYWEGGPGGASRIWFPEHPWGDGEWLAARPALQGPHAPLSVYEVHLGSWRRITEGGAERCLTWHEAGDALADYCHHMGFTHVELLPVMEHEDDASLGYAVTGWFAPTARYGAPEGLMALVDRLHRRRIGVILDWAPAVLTAALVRFDGSGPFAAAGLSGGGTFDFARPEVRSFLRSSAVFWLERFHGDGLRIPGLGEILYPGSRPGGQGLRTGAGGGEDPHALRFVQELTTAVHQEHPGVLVIAEESTAWPRVTRAVQDGGLGFDLKWSLGWMHDTLAYLAEDPIYRKHHHERLTASLRSAFSERFLLPLPHSLVTAGKGSLVARMPGDDWQKQATLRLLAGWLFAHPGRKLMFMGDEIGQWREWAPQRSLDWHLLDFPGHQGIQAWIRDLNHLYRRAPALFQQDFSEDGFAWVEANDAERSVIAFLRRGQGPDDLMLVVANFTPVVRQNYRLGVPRSGWWQEVLNGDARGYGGSSQGNLGGIEADPVGAHGQFQSLSLTLPPLAVIFLQYQGEGHAEHGS